MELPFIPGSGLVQRTASRRALSFRARDRLLLHRADLHPDSRVRRSLSPRVAGRSVAAAAGKPQDGGGVGDHPLDHLAGDVCLVDACVFRPLRTPGGRLRDLGRGQAVDVVPAASRGTFRDQRAARPAGPGHQADDDLSGRDPQLLRAGVPGQAGRAPRPVHVALVPAHEGRPVSPVLRRVLRDEPLPDDRLGPRHGAGRLRALADGRRARPVAGRGGRASSSSGITARAAIGAARSSTLPIWRGSTGIRCRSRRARTSSS